MTRFGRIGILALLAMAFETRMADAQAVGDGLAGHRLAQRWCSNCHAIDPVPQHANDTAPTFAAIANMPSTTPLALSVFLQTPHAQMPDLHLSRNEIDDLTTYILSLRRK
jgi:mono/diheme cytochrome c family protein